MSILGGACRASTSQGASQCSTGTSALTASAQTEPEQEREKESQRWFRGLQQGLDLARARGNQPVVVVGNSESDIYDPFKKQSEHEDEGLELLVRVHRGRQRKVRVRCPHLRKEMLRPIEDHADCMRQGRFQRSFRVLSQGASGLARGGGSRPRCASGPWRCSLRKSAATTGSGAWRPDWYACGRPTQNGARSPWSGCC